MGSSPPRAGSATTSSSATRRGISLWSGQTLVASGITSPVPISIQVIGLSKGLISSLSEKAGWVGGTSQPFSLEGRRFSKKILTLLPSLVLFFFFFYLFLFF